ncbi:MAG: efflux RND transporter periplasmic adaptor subunit [Flavobacteriaceae bacterium]|nr:efflux RND transporter periplasmic adaptor subunit [Flavobacteriaceae bacterium]MDH3796119.1 efflux RND transporter periplasmic adaptor subunit [Flavobacteriaceae bacterium]
MSSVINRIFSTMDVNKRNRVFIVSWIILLILGCSEQEEKIRPEERDITASVYASVTVQPDSLYQVYAAVGGILDALSVEEGDALNKGDAIVKIVNNQPELNSENARLNLELARENYSGSNAVLQSLKDEILATRLQLKNDSLNYFRQKALWEQQIGSKAEYESRELAYSLSRNRLEVLEGNLGRTSNELRTKYIQAQNNYRSARITTEDFTVSSKINGTLYAFYKNPGEIVSTMEPIAAVGKTDDFLVEMLVDEQDIVQVKKGQQVLVTLDAYANQVYEALVSKIIPKKDERSQTFKVEALFKDPPATLYPGLAGEGNIVIGQKKNALTIPRSYLVNGDRVRTEDGITKVSLGLGNLEYVEIVEGIDKSTALLKPEE